MRMDKKIFHSTAIALLLALVPVLSAKAEGRLPLTDEEADYANLVTSIIHIRNTTHTRTRARSGTPSSSMRSS